MKIYQAFAEGNGYPEDMTEIGVFSSIENANEAIFEQYCGWEITERDLDRIITYFDICLYEVELDTQKSVQIYFGNPEEADRSQD